MKQWTNDVPKEENDIAVSREHWYQLLSICLWCLSVALTDALHHYKMQVKLSYVNVRQIVQTTKVV